MADGSGDIFDTRFEEVDALFAATLDLPPDRRMAYLREACGGDLVLFSAVQELLAALEPADELLDREAHGALWSRALEAWRPEVEVAPGDVLGAFRVVREVGRGGMGTVYEAERCDDQFRQRVALKVLRRGLDTTDIVQRFVAERQILASLQHPNIARVLDGGATSDGRPFLVMELVDGEPVLEYCSRRHMSVTDRLRLFLRIAGAVQHAHRNLVVHRDLKPSNILVTEGGVPKLLDFGIAKILDSSTVPSSTPLTEAGRLLLTTTYASPEQVRGAPVTTSSDVYQLGLLLHEMLIGRPAHPRGDAEALHWILSSEEAPRPSSLLARSSRRKDPGLGELARKRGTDPSGLRQRLRGDLDAIVLTSIGKEPSRRYGSVEALARDIRRHLDGRPISARRDSATYRLTKFVRRNRPLATAVALLVILVAGYVVTLHRQARVLEAERRAAESEARKAERVKDFLVGTFEMADPTRTGEDMTVRKILETGARRVRTELADQPAVEMEMLGVIASVYDNLNLDDEAKPLLERAVAIWEETGVDSASVAPSLALLGGCMARAFRQDSAQALFRRAVAVAGATRGPTSPLAGRVLTKWAYNEPDPDLHARLADSAAVILERYPDRAADLAGALMANPGGGEGTTRVLRALRLRTEAFGKNSAQVAWTLDDLGLALQWSDPDSAEVLIRKALAIQRRLVGDRDATTLSMMNNLAGLLRDHGRCDEAESLYRHVLDIRREETPNATQSLAYSEYGLGWCLGEIGHVDEAERLLKEVIETFPEGDHRRDRARAVLGHALAVAGRYDEAETFLDRAVKGMNAWEYPATDGEAFILARLEDLYRRSGRTKEADATHARLTRLRSQPPMSASARVFRSTG